MELGSSACGFWALRAEPQRSVVPVANIHLPRCRPSAPTSSASSSPTTAATCWPAGPAPISPSVPSCSWEPTGRWGFPVAAPGLSASLQQTDLPPCALQGPGVPVMQLLSHSLQSGRGRCPYSPRQPFAALLVGKSGVTGKVLGKGGSVAAPGCFTPALPRRWAAVLGHLQRFHGQQRRLLPHRVWRS